MATTTDLIRIAFVGMRRDTAAARLRRLFDGEFLSVRSPSRMSENLYSLGPRGRAWLAEQGEEVGTVPRGDLAHHLSIVEAWSTIALEAQNTPGCHLDLLRPDWEIRSHAPAAAPVIPDAMIQLTVADQHVVRLALEVDLGTESPAILAAKVSRYEALLQGVEGLFGWQSFALVVAPIGATAARRSGIQRILESRWSGAHFILDISGEGASALSNIIHSLAPPLTESPYVRGLQGSQVTDSVVPSTNSTLPLRKGSS